MALANPLVQDAISMAAGAGGQYLYKQAKKVGRSIRKRASKFMRKRSSSAAPPQKLSAKAFKLIARRRRSPYRQKKLNGAMARTGNKKLKSARFRINSMYPNSTSCILDVHGNSNDYPLLGFEPGWTGSKSYMRTLQVNSSRILIDQDLNELQDTNPIDYMAQAKIQNYTKGRINLVKLSVTFTIMEPNFKGVVFLFPCVYGPVNNVNNNYFSQDVTALQNCAYGPETKLDVHPNQISYELFKNQTIFRSKQVNTMSTLTKPVKVTLSNTYRIRDLVGLTAEEYKEAGPINNGPGGWCNIFNSGGDGITLDTTYPITNPGGQTSNSTRPWYADKAFVKYGVMASNYQSYSEKGPNIDVKIHMKQYVQLIDPMRIDLPSGHYLV